MKRTLREPCTIGAGRRPRRYAFVFRHNPRTCAYVFVLSGSSPVTAKYLVHAADREAQRMCEIMVRIRQEHAELLPLLDEEFFHAVRFAVRGREISRVILRRQFARLRGVAGAVHG